MNSNTTCKSGKIYNDKFCLKVLSLRHIDKATDDDKKWHVDEWAKLFKASTWEELKMIAEKNDIYTETMNAMMYVNADEIERQKAQAREDYNKRQRYVSKLESQLEDMDAQLQNQQTQLQEQLAINKQLQEQLDAMRQSPT